MAIKYPCLLSSLRWDSAKLEWELCYTVRYIQDVASLTKKFYVCAVKFRFLKVFGYYDWFFMNFLLVYLCNEFLKIFSEGYLFRFIDISKGIFQHFLVICTQILLPNSWGTFKTQPNICNVAPFAKIVIGKNRLLFLPKISIVDILVGSKYSFRHRWGFETSYW